MLRRLRALSRRQRALLAAGISVGAAGAYYLGSALLEAWQDEERTLALRALSQQREREAHEREAEQQLHDHFDSIQRISDTTTLPTLLPPLRTRLFALADVDALTRRLQEAATGSAPLSSADKVALWEQLKVQSFARTLASAWSVCLLDLFLRVQLNLLGSHVYLSAALKDPKSAAPSSPHSAARQNAPTPAAEGRPALSLSAQHAYLALHSHFIREGTAVLAPVLVAACRTALADVPLKAAVTFDQLCGLLGLAHRDALALMRAPHPTSNGGSHHGHNGSPVVARCWSDILMPPHHTDAILVSQQASSNDAQLLAALLAETRSVLTGGRFATVLASAMEAALRTVFDALKTPFLGASALPMAKLVPVVAAATDRALMAPPAPPSGSVTFASRPGSGGTAFHHQAASASVTPVAATCAAGAHEDGQTTDAAPSPRSPGDAYAAGVAAVIGKLPCVDALCADLFSAVT